MIGFALLLALVRQDTNTVLSPRVRGMLDQFPAPRAGQPSIAVRFSRDTVWLGEQAELVTGTWFPRQLRDRLRHQPTIAPPSLTGLWSARSQLQPVPASTRVIDHQVYDLYVTYQTIFPLGAGDIVAPPAVLTYGVPTSTSYFAPEERRTVRSMAATLHVRAIPGALAATIGTGPTAHNLHVAWRGPAVALHVGAPAIVELVISGEGNLTLWPAPQVTWPARVHVYPEPTEEHASPIQGIIAGEKRFRFTVVPDTAGVLTLPPVNYIYFDPATVTARTAATGVFELPVLPRADDQAVRAPLALDPIADVPIASTLRRSWWPMLLLLVAAAPLLGLRRPRRTRLAPAIPGEPEQALRTALGTPVAAGPDHVVAALRARGVPRDDAEHMHRWISAATRRRYGPQHGDALETPSMFARVLARLRHALPLVVVLLLAAPLRGQLDGGADRYHSGDYAGAARMFARAARADRDDVTAWSDLGAARWMQGDDVRAAAAWLVALRLAPRDDSLLARWLAIPALPSDVRAMPPSLPLSRDELVLLAALAWCLMWLLFARRYRRSAGGMAGVAAAALLVAGLRIATERSTLAIVATDASVHISPESATPIVASLPEWSEVYVERASGTWLLVRTQTPSATLQLSTITEGWLPASAVATIGPLD